MGLPQFGLGLGERLAGNGIDQHDALKDAAALYDLFQRRQRRAAGDAFARAVKGKAVSAGGVLGGVGRPAGAPQVGEGIPKAFVKL